MGTIKKDLLVREPFGDYSAGRVYAMPDMVTNGLTGKHKNVLALQVSPMYGRETIYTWSIPWEYLVNPDGFIIKPYDKIVDASERCHIACTVLFALLVAGDYDRIKELSKENTPSGTLSGWQYTDFEKSKYPANAILSQSTIPQHVVDNLYKYGTDPVHGDWMKSIRWFT